MPTLSNPILDRLHHTLPGFRARTALRLAWSRMNFASPRPLIENYTMLPIARLDRLERSVRDVVRRGIPGDVVECGCARGGSAALAALTLQRERSAKKVYLFDTFEGLPQPSEHDPDHAADWVGECLGTLDEVQALFEGLDIRSQAVFVKGLFQDTLAEHAPDQIAFLHMDGDWFESTRAILVHLWDRVAPGGIVQLDDYGDWHGCRKAFDEFMEARKLEVARHPIDGRAVWIEKP